MNENAYLKDCIEKGTAYNAAVIAEAVKNAFASFEDSNRRSMNNLTAAVSSISDQLYQIHMSVLDLNQAVERIEKKEDSEFRE